MASSGVFCILCYDDGPPKDAVTWCTECEVFLCMDCEKHHKKSIMSKDHKTMSIKDYHKLPTFMQEISSQCKDHKKKFELYCSFHACPCCVQCVTDKHQKCQEMKPLTDILTQIKSSASVQLFEKDLKDVKENFDEIIKYLNSRLNISNIQKVKAAEQIRSLKNSIDELLNKIEQEILDDLENKHSKLQSDMDTFLQQLEQRDNQISQLQSGFSEMTQLATELQMYIGLREIEKTTSEAATYIDALTKGDMFDEKNLDVTLSPSLLSILQDVKSFGDININTSQSTLKIKGGRNDQAQNLALTYPGFEEIKPTILRTLTIPDNSKLARIAACRILPDGNYIILNCHWLEDSGHLLLFRIDGIFTRKIVTFTDSPNDTCFVRKKYSGCNIRIRKPNYTGGYKEE
ncbi:unnamed protein product [Mytilus edulis]|uniref:B box-type domain-containing protein n=1 Tax=Mytilus edulis TaxID=6550 RepID=A0A8S3QJ64_MYTED|nr:unnamed protein product [Mytilus edulis]